MSSQLNKLKLILLVSVSLFSGLLAALARAYSQDSLLTITCFIVTVFLLSFAAVHFYQTCLSTLLSSYGLSQRNNQASSEPINPQLQQKVLSSVFASWSAPIAVFDQQGLLCFFNHQLAKQVTTPLCRGMSRSECGFSQNREHWFHPDLSKHWSIDSFSLPLDGSLVITASNIGSQLQLVKKQSENNLIRILSHELNNSITPIASLADTLLSAEQLDPSQVKMVLTRIKSRSEKLLEFIQSYAQLSRLPKPQIQRFSLRDMAYSVAKEQSINLQYKGLSHCYADPMLFEQLLINLFKNAQEACLEQCQICLLNEQQGEYQHITVGDNGAGFANLDNAVTPLYTTKQGGQGLGLSLCDDIVSQHQGTLSLSNTDLGAQVKMQLPLITL